LASWLNSYPFQLKASKIIGRGLGLTVALAWDALLVRFVVEQDTTFGNYTLWVYALLVTLICSFLVITISTSSWIENAQKWDNTHDAEKNVTRMKSAAPSLLFQAGEEDDLLDDPTVND